MSHHTRSSQSTVLSNWSRLQIERPQTRKERATFPRAIPHVFADARQLPVRLLKGQRLTRLIQYTGLGMIALMLTGCSGPTAPTVHAQEAAEPVRLMQPRIPID